MKPPEEQDPDLELVQRVREAGEGDVRAFETLVERHQQRVLANCRYLTRSAHDAEDLAQEVFVKAYYGLSRFEGRSSFRTWLQRIKVNHTLNHLRRVQGKSFIDLDEAELEHPEELKVAPTAERSASSGDERERIIRILESLSDALRVPLILRDMDQLSYQEIADLLGIGLSAVKMRIKRAREEFRRRYDAEAIEAGEA